MSNTEKTFTAGQRVYSLQGHAARYVAPAKETQGHIVEAFYIDEDDAEAEEPSYAGEVVVWRQAFAKPPKALIDDEIRNLIEHGNKLRADIVDLRAQQSKAEAAMKAVRDSLKTHEALKYVDDILAGHITHYVVVGDREAYVWSHQQVVEKKPDWFTDHSGDRMLTLRLNSWQTRGANWTMQGREQSRKVWPFTNEADAVAKCREVVSSLLDAMARPDHYFNAWVFQSLANSAAACGVEIPAALVERKAREELSAAQAAAAKAEQELSAARIRITIAQQSFPKPPPVDVGADAAA